MFEGVKRKIAEWRRKRRIARIRRMFAKCGYPLDHLDDFGVEAAFTGGVSRLEEVPLTAKTIYFTLRRLSPGERTYLCGRRKNARAAQRI